MDRRAVVVWFVSALVSALAGGCSSPSRACVPGATQSCLCAGAVTGAQSCASDGMSWGECLCTGPATAEPAPALVEPEPAAVAPEPAPVAPTEVAPTEAEVAPAVAVECRSIAEIVRDYRPTDAADRFLWLSTVNGSAQVHCAEHAVEAARRAARLFRSDEFICEDTSCHYNHDGIADPQLVARRCEGGDGVRLIAYVNGYAGDTNDERIAGYFADLDCGEISRFEPGPK